MLALTLSCALSLAPTPTLADELPEGADLVVRVRPPELWADLVATYEELAPLLPLWPELRAELTAAIPRLVHWHGQLQTLSGVDLRQATTLTLIADLDPKAPVVVLVARGLSPKALSETPPAGFERRLLEGTAAIFATDQDLGVAVAGEVVLAGSSRGVARQLRHLSRAATPPSDVLVKAAGRMRAPGPVELVLALRDEKRRTLLRAAGPFIGPALAPVRVLSVVADDEALSASIDSDGKKGAEVLGHALRAIAAAWQAAGDALAAASEWGLALERGGGRLPTVPPQVTAEDLKSLSRWLLTLRIEPRITNRPGNRVEARFALSDARALAVAAFALAGLWRPTSRDAGEQEAERLLFVLREVERAHRQSTGAYQSCPPTPATLPKAPLAWPEEGCFQALGFRPDTPTRFQLSASAEGERLTLMARGDSDADGVPEVYYLDDSAAAVRSFAPR